ncbi:hypothetical protein [Pleionea sp. CnH1-48]|uniref:hypothetical protein n=1 Tax=Pleionea sp. CnH1-48 TaxID=2954494 RepID=UPI002096AEF2|nr:hypothetical protein [Pleionea sp. CnH1-48]MCO7226328.1 hypothetical protein [Pleionea sp. CnH1-48]
MKILSIKPEAKDQDGEEFTIGIPCALSKNFLSDVPSVVAVSYLSVTPEKEQPWVTEIYDESNNRNKVDGTLKLFFSAAYQGTEYLEKLQKAVLVVSLDGNNDDEDWVFIDKGIVFTNWVNHNVFEITTELSDSRKQLTITVFHVGDTGSTKKKANYVDIGFRYVAACEDKKKKTTTVHVSQDPSIGVSRGKGG